MDSDEQTSPIRVAVAEQACVERDDIVECMTKGTGMDANTVTDTKIDANTVADTETDANTDT